MISLAVLHKCFTCYPCYLCSLVLAKLHQKQVDILISKNQALKILYLKHHVYKTS